MVQRYVAPDVAVDAVLPVELEHTGLAAVMVQFMQTHSAVGLGKYRVL